MSVEKAAFVTLACCVLHNYCEVQRQRVPVPADIRLQHDPFVGFHVGQMQLPHEGVAGRGLERCFICLMVGTES